MRRSGLDDRNLVDAELKHLDRVFVPDANARHHHDILHQFLVQVDVTLVIGRQDAEHLHHLLLDHGARTRYHLLDHGLVPVGMEVEIEVEEPVVELPDVAVGQLHQAAVNRLEGVGDGRRNLHVLGEEDDAVRRRHEVVRRTLREDLHDLAVSDRQRLLPVGYRNGAADVRRHRADDDQQNAEHHERR